MVGRAWRKSLLAGHTHVTREALAEVASQFMPSTQGLERELQETAAMIELGHDGVRAAVDLTAVGGLVVQTDGGARVDVLAADVHHLRPA